MAHGDGLSDLVPKIVYQPVYKENQIVKFRMFVEKRFGISLRDYWDLHQWSCKHFPEFWECVWNYFGIISSQPFTEVFDRSRHFYNMEWFKGARLNYTENVFKYKDSHTALIAIDNADNTESFTYLQMYQEVCQYARALKTSGLKKGDVVACYMPNKKEAVFAFLAVASIGAIWSGTLPILGLQALLSRLSQISPKLLFTSGDFVYDGKQINMMDKLRQAVSELPSLERVVFVPTKSRASIEDFKSISKCCSIDELLESPRKEYIENPWDLEYEQVPFDHPLSISFTSGTTGAPKELVHSTGACFASIRDYGLMQDITRDDVLMNFSPVGWISWNMFVNSLHLGVTLIMYEGTNPYEESPTRFWDLVDRFGITSVYMWSSSAEVMERKGYLPTAKHKLTTLKQMFPIGSVTKRQTFDFFQRIKPGMFMGSVYGITEVYGMICGLDSNLPVYRGEMQCFALGMDIRCFDDNGREVIGEKGNVVIANPFPAMPISCSIKRNAEKMPELHRNKFESVLNRFPGFWFVGDEMWINPVTKGFILYGRCDDTLNPKGARFNCSEIYFALEDFPGLVDSVCVSQFDADRDERVILFVKLEPGIVLTESIKKEICDVIERNLTYEHVPDVIIQVPDVPYNLTGKKLNLIVKKLINKMPANNAQYVVNPESLEFFRNLDLGDF